MSAQVFEGDCLDVMANMPDNHFDAIVTDPPYHFTSIVKRFGAPNAAPAKGDIYARASRGFMGKEWDGGDIAFRPETWAEALRIMKPGAHLVAFGAPKNYHRLACAIEDAGFEIRDSLMWVFGSGFPKSLNVGNGWGTALKPAYEPIVLARKPLSEKTVAANVLRWGTGALNIDATRVGDTVETWPKSRARPAVGEPNALYTHKLAGNDKTQTVSTGDAPPGRWPANLCHDGSQGVLDLFPNDAGRFFYCAKASKQDRAGSKHPTVKPINLMRWLIRMVTPPNGLILDPFGGSGTTGAAAMLESVNAILIEREAEYIADIHRRISAAE